MDEDLTKVRFEPGELDCFNVYTPHLAPHGPSWYGINAPLIRVDHLGVFPNATRAIVRVKSRFAPRVIPGVKPINDLIHQLQALDAQNLSRDRIFRDVPLILHVQKYEGCHERFGRFEGLGLRAVEFA